MEIRGFRAPARKVRRAIALNLPCQTLCYAGVMSRRWFIRGCFAGLSLICISMWGWSYPFREHLAYNGATSQEIVIEIGGGSLFLGRNWGFMHPPGWQYYHTSADPHAGEMDSLGYRLLRFQFAYSPPPAGWGPIAKIPFWFLTALCICLLWISWRKTRPLPKGRSFPVEAQLSLKHA